MKLNRKELTDVERMTMQLFADGLTRLEVMRALEISESGLYQRTSSVRAKLGQGSVHGALFVLGWSGLVDTESMSLPIWPADMRSIDLLARGMSIKDVAKDAGRTPAQISRLWQEVITITRSRTKEHLSARWGATLRAIHGFPSALNPIH